MWKMIVLAAMVAATAGAAQAQERRAFTAAEKIEAAKSVTAARGQFDKVLFDYTSARFRDVTGHVGGPAKVVRLCGYVNSRNRMGAYVGWKPFVYIGGASGDGLVIEDDREEIIYRMLCVEDRDDEPRVFDTKDYAPDLTYRPD